jgi:hypothetical protein
MIEIRRSREGVSPKLTYSSIHRCSNKEFRWTYVGFL